MLTSKPPNENIDVAIKQGNDRCAHCPQKATWIIGMIKDEGFGMAKKVCIEHFIATAKSVENILNEKKVSGM